MVPERSRTRKSAFRGTPVSCVLCVLCGYAEKLRQRPGPGVMDARMARWLSCHALGPCSESARRLFDSSRSRPRRTALTAATSAGVTSGVTNISSDGSKSPEFVVAVIVPPYSGMFPCFFGGRLARLVRSARSALVTATRVAAGSMTPSSSPRSAARNGLATL